MNCPKIVLWYGSLLLFWGGGGGFQSSRYFEKAFAKNLQSCIIPIFYTLNPNLNATGVQIKTSLELLDIFSKRRQKQASFSKSNYWFNFRTPSSWDFSSIGPVSFSITFYPASLGKPSLTREKFPTHPDWKTFTEFATSHLPPLCCMMVNWMVAAKRGLYIFILNNLSQCTNLLFEWRDETF